MSQSSTKIVQLVCLETSTLILLTLTSKAAAFHKKWQILQRLGYFEVQSANVTVSYSRRVFINLLGCSPLLGKDVWVSRIFGRVISLVLIYLVLLMEEHQFSKRSTQHQKSRLPTTIPTYIFQGFTRKSIDFQVLC